MKTTNLFKAGPVLCFTMILTLLNTGNGSSQTFCTSADTEQITGEQDGYIYELWNQPSIIGNTTFQQYFSIRRETRNSGTINISDHFNKWMSLGMQMGKMHEVSFVVEGFRSNGAFEFEELEIWVK